MIFASIRLITADVDRLVGFFERVTGLPATRYTADFAEIVTAAGTLAIAGTRTLALFGDTGTRAADNRSVIIEFLVDDVDETFRRLEGAGNVTVVQQPATMPWGNRSVLIRDPDGNLVNLFAPVTPDARARVQRHGIA